MSAWLCSLSSTGAQDGCLQLTSTNGTTSAFSEKYAKNGFKFYFYVNNGGGYISPINTVTKTKVIVNYN
jgi:hypothetical protein